MLLSRVGQVTHASLLKTATPAGLSWLLRFMLRVLFAFLFLIAAKALEPLAIAALPQPDTWHFAAEALCWYGFP